MKWINEIYYETGQSFYFRLSVRNVFQNIFLWGIEDIGYEHYMDKSQSWILNEKSPWKLGLTQSAFAWSKLIVTLYQEMKYVQS